MIARIVQLSLMITSCFIAVLGLVAFYKAAGYVVAQLLEQTGLTLFQLAQICGFLVAVGAILLGATFDRRSGITG